MPKTAIPFIIILLSAAFIHPANAQGIQPGLRKVIMYNRATKEIKPACMEIVGKYDVIPSYECYDEKDKKSIPFDPGKDWLPISITPICMKNKATGVVKSDCIKYISGKNADVKYLDHVEKTGKPVELDVQWEPLPSDDPMCKSIKFSEDDPIKHFDFEIISDLEAAKEEESEK